MNFTEVVDLETHFPIYHHFIIAEDNVKIKTVNKSFKVGGSYQYMSADYNDRFITWRGSDNILTLTEISTQHDLIGNSIKIELEKSKILSVKVYETESFIEFCISGSMCVVRFSLHHPSKLRNIAGVSSIQHSIFYDVSDLNEVKYLLTPYFDADNISAVSAIIVHSSNDAYFNYGLADGSVFTIVVPDTPYSESVYHYEMKEGYYLTKLLSGFMSRQNSNDYTDVSIIEMDYVNIDGKLYLISVGKDNKLKVWNLKDRCCCASEDLLNLAIEANPDWDRSPSTINYKSLIASHKIKSFHTNASVEGYSDTVLVYFHSQLGQRSLQNWMVFRILEPTSNRGCLEVCVNVRINLTSVAPTASLIDFMMGYNMTGNRLVGVWTVLAEPRTADGQLSCYSYKVNWQPLSDSEINETCVDVRMYEPWRSLDIFVHDDQDVQDAVMSCLFTPGNASLQAVINVINKYKDSNEEISVESKTVNDLKKELVILIEMRVEKETQSYIDTTETTIDILEINRSHWFSLLQEVISEHVTLLEPVCLLSVAGTIGIVSMGGFVSLLRSPTGLEHIVADKTPTNSKLQQFFGASAGSGYSLLNYLYSCLNIYRASETWSSLEHILFVQGGSPKEFIRDLLPICPDIPSNVQTRLENFPDTIEKTIQLLEQLELTDYQLDDDRATSPHHLSIFGISLLHYTLRQTIHDRIMLSMSLLALLLPRILNSSQPLQLNAAADRLVVLIKSLASMHWLLSLRQSCNQELSDSQKETLSGLGLLEGRGQEDRSNDVISLKVLRNLQNHIQLVAGPDLSWQLKMREQLSALLAFLNPTSDNFALIQIAKYFLSYNLPLELIDFLKFLTSSQPVGWYNGDMTLIQFLLGICYLILGKPWKALESFKKSVSEPELSSSLLPAILLLEESRDIKDISVLKNTLTLKYVDIFENYGVNAHCIVELVNFGVSCVNDSLDDQNLIRIKTFFYIILFNNFMDLHKFDEARLAITHNPDVEKQKDCLRQFIITLCEQKNLTTLVNFDYGVLSDEFINIVTSRARVSDLSDPSVRYYELLFSYHMRRSDSSSDSSTAAATEDSFAMMSTRAASCCMLELALQLERQYHSAVSAVSSSGSGSQHVAVNRPTLLAHLQRQLGAYLACICAAELLPIELQQLPFVLPLSLARFLSDHQEEDDDLTYEMEIAAAAAVAKDGSGSAYLTASVLGDIDAEGGGDTAVVEREGPGRCVVNLDSVRRQYCLLRSRLRLIAEAADDEAWLLLLMLPLIAPTTTETAHNKDQMHSVLHKLLELGLYTDACQLCREFSIDLNLVIESVANRCIQIHNNCLDRLVLKEKENLIDALQELRPLSNFSAVESVRKLAWLLLQELLSQNRCPNLALTACRCLLAGGLTQLPSWLVSDVTERYGALADLVRLFLRHGVLDQAALLVLGALDDQMDEIYSAQATVIPLPGVQESQTVPQIKWLPLSVIFNVLDILQHMKNLDTTGKAKDFESKIRDKLKIISSQRLIEQSNKPMSIDMN